MDGKNTHFQGSNITININDWSRPVIGRLTVQTQWEWNQDVALVSGRQKGMVVLWRICVGHWLPLDSRAGLRCWNLGLPGGPVVGNLLANAGDRGSVPGWGRFHMPWSNWAHEPQLLSPCTPRSHAPQQEKPRQWEAWAPQLEKTLVQNEDPVRPKINK